MGIGDSSGNNCLGGICLDGLAVNQRRLETTCLILFWVGFIFITQSISHVKAMRYQLPIYPALALIAAWTIIKLWELQPRKVYKLTRIHINWNKVVSVVLAVVTIVGSGLWAFAFTRIYTRPVTRVAASEWIYGHIPAAINLQVDPDSGMQYMQPIAYQNSAYISAESHIFTGTPQLKMRW